MSHAELPADRSIVRGHDRFFLVRIPRPPVTRVRLIEIPVHDGPATPKVLSVDPDKLRLAISRGVVTIVRLDPSAATGPGHTPARAPRVTLPRRPYPFEASRVGRQRRQQFWYRSDVAALVRRGLLMTGAEYARQVEAMRRRALRSDDLDAED